MHFTIDFPFYLVVLKFKSKSKSKLHESRPHMTGINKTLTSLKLFYDSFPPLINTFLSHGLKLVRIPSFQVPEEEKVFRAVMLSNSLQSRNRTDPLVNRVTVIVMSGSHSLDAKF